MMLKDVLYVILELIGCKKVGRGYFRLREVARPIEFTHILLVIVR